MTTHSEQRAINKAKSTMLKASKRFVDMMGQHLTNPLALQYIAEAAATKGYKLDAPCDITDISFIGDPAQVIPRIMNGKSTSTRPERRRVKRKYESPNILE